MIRCLPVLCAGVVLALLVGCTSAPPPPPPDTHDADVQALKDNEAQWVQEYRAKDLDKLVALRARCDAHDNGSRPWHWRGCDPRHAEGAGGRCEFFAGLPAVTSGSLQGRRLRLYPGILYADGDGSEIDEAHPGFGQLRHGVQKAG